MATAIAGKKEATTASEVLRHPIRVRILEALAEVDLSPKQFFHSGRAHGVPGLRGKDQDAVLTHIAYHFRVLAKSGCIGIVATRQVRGAVEHIYQSNARAQFSKEEWDALSLDERSVISKVMMQSFMAQVEGAMLSGTFDARPERCLAWVPIQLDEKGWQEIAVRMEKFYFEVRAIERESVDRMEQSEEAGIPVTFGVFGFETPPRLKP